MDLYTRWQWEGIGAVVGMAIVLVYFVRQAYRDWCREQKLLTFVQRQPLADEMRQVVAERDAEHQRRKSLEAAIAVGRVAEFTSQRMRR